jgi:hypothetical protein
MRSETMQRLTSRGLLALAALGLAHCAGQQEDMKGDPMVASNDKSSPDAPSTSPAAKQGVRGKVVKKTGNFMPGPRPAGGQTTPLSVPVHVFRGKLKPLAAPDPRHPNLVTVVKSGNDGSFEIPLEPGEYTIVAEIGGKLYLNSFDGDGSWTTVTVKPGAFTDWNIDDTSEAAF